MTDDFTPDSGASMIAAERQRQVAYEHFDADHDDEHGSCELVDAARCYLLAAHWSTGGGGVLPTSLRDSAAVWPWDESWWKPSTDPVRNLVKAGALIAAEIDRLMRRSDH